MTLIRHWLAHPLTRGHDLDDPRITHLRRRIILEKPFLRKLYREWYASIARALSGENGPVLELGSGAGFLRDYVPGLITSDVFYCDGLRAVLDGQHLPFADSRLRAIVMTNVLHHVPTVRLFLYEAARCLRPGGVVIMIEPWVTGWSKLIYPRLHHEPFQPRAEAWEFPSSGPLSGANGALPWIIFERDRTQFEREYPEWVVQKIEPLMPFCYLVSGGSMRSLMPGCSFGVWRFAERTLAPWMHRLAMFAEITLWRTG